MKSLSFRLSDKEKQHLYEYCRITQRTQSDVLRQYIRSLSVDGVQHPIDRLAIPLDADSENTARGS
jgi:predicted transcriptional regulator